MKETQQPAETESMTAAQQKWDQIRRIFTSIALEVGMEHEVADRLARDQVKIALMLLKPEDVSSGNIGQVEAGTEMLQLSADQGESQ